MNSTIKQKNTVTQRNNTVTQKRKNTVVVKSAMKVPLLKMNSSVGLHFCLFNHC